MIFLTNDLIMPVTIMNTTKMRILKEIGLFWLSWFELYKVLDKYSKNNIPKGEFLIVNDLIEFLKKRGSSLLYMGKRPIFPATM